MGFIDDYANCMARPQVRFRPVYRDVSDLIGATVRYAGTGKGVDCRCAGRDVATRVKDKWSVKEHLGHLADLNRSMTDD